MIDLVVKHQFQRFRLDVTFQVEGGITVLFGPSGAGKSSILNAIAGIYTPQEGHIRVAGRTLFDRTSSVDVPTHRRKVGYVFQQPYLFPHKNVLGNLLFGAKDPSSCDKICQLLDITHLQDRPVGHLSGGEQQRISIGRMLLSQPDVILADEPVSALDIPRRHEILALFERLRDELAIPILYVSHALEEVGRLANQVVVIDQGQVSTVGSAEEVLSDMNRAPGGVRAVGALLTAKVVAHHDDGLSEIDAHGVRLLLPKIHANLGQVVRIRIPAHDVMLSVTKPEGLSALNQIAGVIVAMREGVGPGVMVTLDTKAGPLLARVTRRSARNLNLQIGCACVAVMKSVSVAPGDVGYQQS